MKIIEIFDKSIEEMKVGSFTSWCQRNGFSGPNIGCAKKAISKGDKRVK